MGFAVPAAMGAKLGLPDATVWCIDGDGCFQMTNQELATCAIENIPIKVAVINNGNLGMVRQWQNLFYAERYSNTDLGTHKRIPDFKLLAEAMGCVGLRCETKDQVDEVIKLAMEIDDRPVVIDFVVGADAQVWPMVAAGTSNDEVKTARGIRPLFDEDDSGGLSLGASDDTRGPRYDSVDDAATGIVIDNEDALGGPSAKAERAARRPDAGEAR
jgi:acetolactate synthase-1/2/3 large subunit